MQKAILGSLIALSIPTLTFAAESSHQCRISSVVQRYELSTMKLKSTAAAHSDWFAVAPEPHEDQKDLPILLSGRAVGFAKVWTGTLIGTNDGDVMQAHATFEIEGVSGSAALVMSLDSRFAKSMVVLETVQASELLLIPVDLVASQNRKPA